MNRCLRKFVEWDIPLLDLGMVAVPKPLLDRLAGDKDEHQFEEFGREAARDFLRPATIYITGEFTMASVIETLRRVSTYSGRFAFDFDEGHDSRMRVLVIRHDQGRKWSGYYAGVFEETFKVLLGEQIKIAYTDSLCIVQMPSLSEPIPRA